MSQAEFYRWSAAPDRSFATHYCTHILIYLGIAAAILTGAGIGHFQPMSIAIALYALLYPHLAFHLLRQQQKIKPASTLMLIDTVQISLIIALLGFALVPALAFLLPLFFNALLWGGIRYLGLLLLLNLLLTSLALNIALQPVQLDSPFAVNISSLLFSVMALAIDASRIRNWKRQVEKAHRPSVPGHLPDGPHDLRRYLTPSSWEALFTRPHPFSQQARRKHLSIFFSDIQGFSELAETLEPEVLAELLNTYLSEMSQIAHQFGGTVDKFIGDGLMVFFGDPVSQGRHTDAVNAVRMAIAMQAHMHVLRRRWHEQGIHAPLQIRMGINSGYGMVGTFGAEHHMDYTVISREVNLANRLEKIATPGEILLSRATYCLVKRHIQASDQGLVMVKGVPRPVHTYQVIDRHSEVADASRYIEHELPGFSIYMDTRNIHHADKEQVITALQTATRQLCADPPEKPA